MITKTLGGDRLGSGKKMQVQMHGYGRSTHNLSRVVRTTMSAGTLVPLYVKPMLPGDTFNFKLHLDVLTLPTIGPLFGRFKVQLDMFKIPMRLYNSKLHNNELEVGLDMSKIKLPQIRLTAVTPAAKYDELPDVDNCQINPSCILKYLGISGIGRLDNETSEPETRDFNAIPVLAYWDIYKNYYANKQEEVGAVVWSGAMIATPQTVDTVAIVPAAGGGGANVIPEAPGVSSEPLSLGRKININYTGAVPDPKQVMINTVNRGLISVYELISGVYEDDGSTLTGTYNAITWGADNAVNWSYLTNSQPVTVAPNILTFPLTNIDGMRRSILAFSDDAAPFVIDDGSVGPYGLLCTTVDNMSPLVNAQEGLGIKTYQSDVFNNWLRDEYITYISTISSVSTAGNSFTMDQLNIAQKVYNLLNRIAVSGGTYYNWIETVYGENVMRAAETPVYMGGKISEIVFQEVVSQSLTEGQPLGTLAGKGRLGSNHKGGDVIITVDEPCMVMLIGSITPMTDYSQGNEWFVNLETYDDFHKPELDAIGFEDSINERRAWWTTSSNTVAWLQTSAGKVPAWINYQTDVNKTFGNFAIPDNQMFMTLNRRYTLNGTTGQILDLTTYIDPNLYNFVFAEASQDAMNFWVQVGVEVTARRKMSARIIPNL